MKVTLFITIWAVCAMFLVSYILLEKSCEAKAKMQDLQFSFGALQGCMVKGEQTNNKWIDYDRFRSITQ
ncbi:MAG: hypothetical protein IJ211_07550 [Campylobacter sp.]|nr:hypothetical protein [Campylobacter sp.]